MGFAVYALGLGRAYGTQGLSLERFAVFIRVVDGVRDIMHIV